MSEGYWKNYPLSGEALTALREYETKKKLK